jgi:hypothetical protein
MHSMGSAWHIDFTYNWTSRAIPASEGSSVATHSGIAFRCSGAGADECAEKGLLIRQALDLMTALKLAVHIALDKIRADEFCAMLIRGGSCGTTDGM